MKRRANLAAALVHEPAVLYMEEAQRLCDRVAIMDQGRVLIQDTPQALIQAHGGPARGRAQVLERVGTARPASKCTRANPRACRGLPRIEIAARLECFNVTVTQS